MTFTTASPVDRLLGDLRGGLAGAALVLGGLLPISLIAFGALGPDAAAHAVRAAFAAVIFGNLAAAAVGGTPISGTTARTSTTLVFAGLVATLAGENLDLSSIILLTTVCTLCAGVLQIGMGLVRAGSLAKYVPLPVVVGFLDGMAVLIIMGQIPPLIGVVKRGAGAMAALQDMRVWALVLGVATLLVVQFIARKRPAWPGLLIGVVLGTLVYIAVQQVFPAANMGPELGAPKAELPLPNGWLELFAIPWPDVLVTHLPKIVITAAIIAVIGSLDSLLSAAATEAASNMPFDANRLLVAQGVANVVSSAFAGLPVAHGGVFAMACQRAGGTSRLCAIPCSLLLLAMLVYGASWLGRIPHTVIAGAMICVALAMFDRWTPLAVRRLLRGARVPELRWSVAIVAIVCVVTVKFGFLVSLALGIILSTLLFVTGLNRSLIRGVESGRTRSSRRIYPTAQAALLHERGEAIKLLTLEGAIFFGTAETLRQEVQALAADAKFVILDLQRVTTLDASGVIVLERLAQGLKAEGTELMLAGIAEGDRHALALQAFTVDAKEGHGPWYADVDIALEHAEERTLSAANVAGSNAELQVGELPLLEGLSAAGQQRIGAVLARTPLAAGHTLFKRGDAGDRLYMLARGSVTLIEGTGSTHTGGRRIVSFKSGVVFGETAMLDGGPRTATAIADSDSIAFTLTRAELDRLRVEAPDLAAQLLFNLACQLSGRLRFATMVLWAGEPDRG